jgi:hypothetical protein
MHDAYLRQRPALGAASGPHVDVVVPRRHGRARRADLSLIIPR